MAHFLRYVADWAESMVVADDQVPSKSFQQGPPAHWVERVRQSAPQLLAPSGSESLPAQQAQQSRTTLMSAAENPMPEASRETQAVRAVRRTYARVEEFAQPAKLTESLQGTPEVDESIFPGVTEALEPPLKPPTEGVGEQRRPPRRATVYKSKTSPAIVQPTTESVDSNRKKRIPVYSSTVIRSTALDTTTPSTYPDLLSGRQTVALQDTEQQLATEMAEPAYSPVSLPENFSQAGSYLAFERGAIFRTTIAARRFEETDFRSDPCSGSAENIWPELPDEVTPIQPSWAALFQRHRREAALLAEQRGEAAPWNV